MKDFIMTRASYSQEKDIRAYVKQISVHNPDAILNPSKEDKNLHFFALCNSGYDQMNSSSYFAEYIAYETGKSCRYTKKKKRYGVWIDIMLPEGNWEKETMVKITRRFADRVRGELKGLKWIAYYYFRGKATIVRIWMADREKYYVPKLIKPVYKRDYYVNQSGCFCGKHDEGAVLKFRKGSVRKDINITNKTLFSETKARLFAYSSRPHAGDEKRNWFLTCLIEAVKGMGIDVQEGFLFKRRKMKRSFNRFVKRCVIAENQLQKNIEDQLNRLWSIEKSSSPMRLKDEKYLHASPGISQKEFMEMKIETTYSRRLEEIFEWINSIFKEGKFTYQDEEYVFHGTRIDYAEHALRVLRIWFDEKLFLLDKQTRIVKGV